MLQFHSYPTLPYPTLSTLLDSVANSIVAQLKPRIKHNEVHVVSTDRLYLTPNREGFLMANLVKVVVQGIPEVHRAVIAKDEPKGGGPTKYHLLIEGSNLLRILGAEGVDGKHSKSNHVIEIEKTLGIEAARTTVRPLSPRE